MGLVKSKTEATSRRWFRGGCGSGCRFAMNHPTVSVGAILVV